MKKLLFILLFFMCRTGVSAQVIDQNGNIVPQGYIKLVRPLFAIDSLTAGIKLGNSLSVDAGGVLNVVFPIVVSAQTTDQKYFVATASPNQAYTIAGLPVSFADFDIFRNRVILYPGIDYKISGNTVTMILAINQGDKIYYSRKK